MTAWIAASAAAGDGGQQDARLPRPELVGAEDAEEAAHQQHALEPDVHHPAALGEHAADGREDERRRVAEHRGGQGRPHERPTPGCATLETVAATPSTPNTTRQHHRRDPEAPAALARPSTPPGRGPPPRCTIGTAAFRAATGGTAIQNATIASDDRRRCPSPWRRAGRAASAQSRARSSTGGPAGRDVACSTASDARRRLGRHVVAPAEARQARPRHAPAVPEVEDQDVGPDEQQHQRLDHLGEVAGEARVEDVRVEAARRGAVEERAEQQRGERRRRWPCCARAGRRRCR